MNQIESDSEEKYEEFDELSKKSLKLNYENRILTKKDDIKKNSYKYFVYKHKINNQKKEEINSVYKKLKKYKKSNKKEKLLKYKNLLKNNNLDKHQKKILNKFLFRDYLEEEQSCICNIRLINKRRFIVFFIEFTLLGLESFLIYMANKNTYIYYKGCNETGTICQEFDNYHNCNNAGFECQKYISGQGYFLLANINGIFWFITIPLVLRYGDPNYKNTRQLCNYLCKNNSDLNCFESPEPKHKKNIITDKLCCIEQNQNPGFGKCCICCVYPFCFRCKGTCYEIMKFCFQSMRKNLSKIFICFKKNSNPSSELKDYNDMNLALEINTI